MMPGLLAAPAFLCPLILSFRESHLAEAWLPRRTFLRISTIPHTLLFQNPSQNHCFNTCHYF